MREKRLGARPRPFWRSRWWMPGFCVVLGVLMLIAASLGGNPGLGLGCLGIMSAVGALFLFGSRASETLAGLDGTGRDERFALIDLQATAAAGTVLILLVIGLWLYELAQGRDGDPYTRLGAVTGVAYVVAVIVLRRRL